MASFYAELHVEGATYRVVHCAYACQQATDARGRVQAKVRHAPLQLVLDVPEGDDLLTWASTPHKPLAGEVVFYDVAQQTAHETIAFTAGECVHYGEQFASGATGDGAYLCQLTITAPSFELRAGGPAGAGGTGVVVREANPADAAGPAPSLPQASELPALSPALVAMLAGSIQVANTAGAEGPANFATAVHADLQAIYATPTGRRLLDSLCASGKQVFIQYAPTNSIEFNSSIWTRLFYGLDGVTPGAGHGVTINYNPELQQTGAMPWNTRPPGIGLAHELIHAEQAAYGRMRRFDTLNPGGPDARNPNKPLQVPVYELDAIGLHPDHAYPFTENSIRAEWNPPQGLREHY